MDPRTVTEFGQEWLPCRTGVGKWKREKLRKKPGFLLGLEWRVTPVMTWGNSCPLFSCTVDWRKYSLWNQKRPRFNPWVRKLPWRGKWQPTPVFLLAKSHGQRSLAGYRPWGCKESDTTERLTLPLKSEHPSLNHHWGTIVLCELKQCAPSPTHTHISTAPTHWGSIASVFGQKLP